MTRHKKVAIVALIFLSILSLVFIFYSGRRKTTDEQGIGPPTIDLGTQVDKINIKLNVSKDDIDIPAKLPVYSIDNTPLSPTDVSRVAIEFGFNSEPMILQDVNQGQVYFWSDPTSDLRITTYLHIIDYKVSPPDQVKNSQFPSEDVIISAARNFLASKKLSFIISPNFSTLRYLSTYGETFQVVDKGRAEVADVFFVEKIGQYPIVNTTIEAGTINTKLDRDNRVIAVYVDQTGSLSEIGKQTTKSFSELVSSLPESKIISIENVDEDVYFTPEKIREVEINKVSVSYLQESSRKQVFLQPIFILEGTAFLVNTAEGKKAVLYLPALKY